MDSDAALVAELRRMDFGATVAALRRNIEGSEALLRAGLGPSGAPAGTPAGRQRAERAQWAPARPRRAPGAWAPSGPGAWAPSGPAGGRSNTPRPARAERAPAEAGASAPSGPAGRARSPARGARRTVLRGGAKTLAPLALDRMHTGCAGQVRLEAPREVGHDTCHDTWHDTWHDMRERYPEMRERYPLFASESTK